MIQQLVWWSNMVGLVISLFGSALLFFNSPRDTPNIPIIETNPMERYDYYKDSDSIAEIKKLQKRQKYSKIGFLLITIGFILQGISQVLQNPFWH